MDPRLVGLRRLLAAGAIANAVLYSLLLPVWEGFDEPFHFAYVQHVANTWTPPDTRMARLSAEVHRSLELAPASHLVDQNLPMVTTYSEYFKRGPEERRKSRDLLDAIPPSLRWTNSEQQNYESHHAPLAYYILAVPERLLAGAPLRYRLAILRILAAVAGALLLYWATARLARLLGIAEPFATVASFCVLASQMTWATVAHVANDWLAVPLAVWMLALLIEYHRDPSLRRASCATLALALGLLTKAYFLAFVPVVLAVIAVRRRPRDFIAAAALCGAIAAPWYLRNYALYGLFSGMQETRTRHSAGEMASAALQMDWWAIARSAAHDTLWTGNNAFITFSANTLNVVLAFLLVALLLWAATRHAAAEWIVGAYILVFLAALFYRSIVIYLDTHASGAAPAPWFAQVLVAPLLCLAALGCARRPRAGRWIAATMALLFGYVLAATYVVKLIPLYSGYEGRTSMANIARLYATRAAQMMDDLSAVAMAPGGWIFALAAVAVALAAWQAVRLIRCLAGPPRGVQLQ